MQEDIVKFGTRHVTETRKFNRELIERALHMRCLAYLANVKANLLIQTIFKIDLSRKELRKQVEEHKLLQESLRRQALIFENTHDSILIIDLEGIVVDCNPATEIIFGYSKTKITGKHFRELYNTGGPSSTAMEIINTVIQDKYWAGEINFTRIDGSSGVCETIAEPLESKEDAEPGLLIIFNHNITERKQYEKELQKSKEAAEKANQAKSVFLASMSHEIRTPMNAIIGVADLLNDTDLSKEQKEYVDIFSGAGKKLLRIINDILDLSKIEAGGLELEHISFDLHEFLENTCGVLSMTAQKKGLKLTKHIKDDVPVHLIGDPDRLRQILINLVGNAIKFTEKGTIEIKVECQKQSKETATLLLSVADTGMGIPDEKMKTIFESFTQADTSTTRKYGGTGLGLTISRQLVEKMGGRLCVKSKEGEGSTFFFTATFEKQEERKRKIPEQEDEKSDIEHRNIGGPSQAADKTHSLHILLAEDDAVNQKLTMHILKKRGHQVTIVENGRMALNEFGKVKFDVILMDVHMPEMDGYEATVKIREKEKKTGGHVPIIALTALAFKEDKEKCLTAGMDGYASKPIQSKELFKMIENVCSGGSDRGHGRNE